MPFSHPFVASAARFGQAANALEMLHWTAPDDPPGDALTAVHEPSPRKKFADDGVPVALIAAIGSVVEPAFVRLIADGVPKFGVVNTGDVVPAGPPVPDAVPASRVATPVPNPVMPVLRGRPVQFVQTRADGVPRAGVTSVGEVPNTNAPEPVSPVTVAARLALDGVVRNVTMPVPGTNPVGLLDTPAETTMSPVAGHVTLPPPPICPSMT